MCNTFTVDADDEPLTDPVTPAADIDAIAHSRMLGAFGISARLPQAQGSLKGAIWAFRALEAAPTAVLRLRGLEPERSYELVDKDTNESRTATGAEWLANGLPLDLAVRPSALILIRG